MFEHHLVTIHLTGGNEAERAVRACSPAPIIGSSIATSYVAAASDLGFATLAANDHLVWQRPWLDGPTTLTSLHAEAGDMALATSISLPAVRHPIVLGKWLTTLGCLTGNRIIAELGPGSSSGDYAAVGVPFEDRWARFDEALRVVKAIVRGDPPPAGFAQARERLDGHLVACGRDPLSFPDLIATMWLCVTETRDEADQVLQGVLAEVLRRDPRALAAQLPVGPPDHCIDLLRSYAQAGAQQILLWPIRDPVHQLHRFHELVAPNLGG